MSELLFKNYVLMSEAEKKLVLDWRNSDKIRTKMVNQDIISWEKHLNFIESLKNRTDKLYYLFCVDGVPVGNQNFVSIKDGICVAGSYIGNENYNGYGIPMMYYAQKMVFEDFKWKRINSDILKSNKRTYLLEKKYFYAKDVGQTEDEFLICYDCETWQKTKSDLGKRIDSFYEISAFSVR